MIDNVPVPESQPTTNQADDNEANSQTQPTEKPTHSYGKNQVYSLRGKCQPSYLSYFPTRTHSLRLAWAGWHILS